MTLNSYPWAIFNGLPTLAAQKKVKLYSDTFHMILLKNTYSYNLNDAIYTDVSGSELPTANGYTVGGVSLGSSVWFNGQNFFTNPVAQWTASGAALVAMWAVIYDFTEVVDPNALLCITPLNVVDGVPVDVVIPDGETLTVQIQVMLVLK